MQIKRATLDNCSQATGTVVVIDVLRAFTTAAFAFASGTEEIVLVSSIGEAFALRRRMPGALLMGEVDGFPIEGFDLTNSPAALLHADLSGKCILHRSTTGTQGVIKSKKAAHLMAASLVCASATARQILRLSPDSLTFVESGVFPGGWGDEDTACADLIAGLLKGEPPDHGRIIQRVRTSKSGLHYSPMNSVFPIEDLELATDIDRFHFAMGIQRENELLVMRPSLDP